MFHLTFIGSQFMQDNPLQLEQKLVQTYLRVQFFRAQSVILNYIKPY